MPRVEEKYTGQNNLVTMGKSWFVSYLYYNYVDKNHNNWHNIFDDASLRTRINAFECSKLMHEIYLQDVLDTSANKLKQNQIGLSGEEVLEMAKKLSKLPV